METGGYKPPFFFDKFSGNSCKNVEKTIDYF